jgi:NAD dependent epimerase/dehydratase family enzyme
MNAALLLSGQRVYPAVALESGFRFCYADIDSALAAIAGLDQEHGRIPLTVGGAPAQV